VLNVVMEMEMETGMETEMGMEIGMEMEIAMEIGMEMVIAVKYECILFSYRSLRQCTL
jgi:hypothetical protein